MEYERNFLLSLRLSDLRLIGWKIGVKAPTTYNKTQLIDEIIKISIGEKSPCEKVLGRPKLNGLNINCNLSADIEEQIENILRETKEKIIKAIFSK